MRPIGLVIAIYILGVFALMGCAVCRPDCRGMNHEDCLSLVASCQQVNAREVPWEYGAGKDPQSR